MKVTICFASERGIEWLQPFNLPPSATPPVALNAADPPRKSMLSSIPVSPPSPQ
jgi:hypothetical protein